jgi:hypothetical protein
LNGIAWLALANRDRESGRAGFEHVLEIDPGNAEAATGLTSSDGVYRYLAEVSGILVSTEQGRSQGFQSRLAAGLTAFDTLELGWRHFTDELLTVSEIGVSTLPSEDFTLGYHRLAPRVYAFSFVYDYRDREDAPTEHWFDASVSLYVTDRVQWFGAYRRSFGDDRYDGHLIRTGVSADLTPSWQVKATVYGSQQSAFDDGETLWSGVIDVSYSGQRNMFLTAGIGVSPSIDNLDVHARAVIPVTDRIAVHLIAAHGSVNAATSLTGGLLFNW